MSSLWHLFPSPSCFVWISTSTFSMILILILILNLTAVTVAVAFLWIIYGWCVNVNSKNVIELNVVDCDWIELNGIELSVASTFQLLLSVVVQKFLKRSIPVGGWEWSVSFGDKEWRAAAGGRRGALTVVLLVLTAGTYCWYCTCTAFCLKYPCVWKWWVRALTASSLKLVYCHSFSNFLYERRRRSSQE